MTELIEDQDQTPSPHIVQRRGTRARLIWPPCRLQRHYSRVVA